MERPLSERPFFMFPSRPEKIICPVLKGVCLFASHTLKEIYTNTVKKKRLKKI